MEQYINVQRGETVVLSTDGVSKDVTLSTAVDTTTSFILISVRGEGTSNAQDLDEIHCTAEFVNSTTIRFKRGNSTNDCVVSWQVVEANPDAPTQAFEVQTGEVVFTSVDTTKSENITNISDSSNAIIIADARWTTSGVGGDDKRSVLFYGTFNSTSQIQLTRQGGAGEVVVRYWVVKWSSDFAVRKGSATITSLNATDTFTEVDENRSVIFIQYGASVNGIGQSSVRAWLSTPTANTINVKKAVTNGNCVVQYAVVEFPAACVAQYNAFDWNSTTYSDTTTISSVDLDATIIVGTNDCTGTGNAHPRGTTTCGLTDATTVTMQRSYSGQTIVSCWTLIDTSAWTFTTTIESDISVNEAPTISEDINVTLISDILYSNETIPSPGVVIIQ